MILLLLACAPTWTREGAVHPTLARLDQDGNGVLDADEWRAGVPGTPTFEAVDTDGSTTVDDAELLAWLVAADPDPMAALPDTAARRRITFTHPTETWLVLRVLRDELIGTAGEALAPTEAELAALAPRPLTDPAVQAALVRLHTATTAAGRPFPAALVPR